MATDTIAAIATAPGRGAIGLLRISGPSAQMIAGRLAGQLPPPRQAGLRRFRDASGTVLDRGLVLSFPGPNSYTGEDLVELQAHGGPVLLDLLLEAACAAGARVARPGEFSERAFLNERIDLAQAEAVIDLIDAGSRQAVVAAQRSLEGEFSRQVQELARQLMELRVWVEGSLDFSDEDIDWLGDAHLQQRMTLWHQASQALIEQSTRGRRLREGLTIAIVGRPNVGKSTLLNRLAGVDAAIVSDTPGTTRDILREHIILDGLPLTVIDTAGLRDSDDPIEREGVRRARIELQKAEAVLCVVDDRDPMQTQQALLAELPASIPRLLIRNKCDLSGTEPQREETGDGVRLRLSAASGAGFDLLRAELLALAGFHSACDSQTVFTARTRHLHALRTAQTHFEKAAQGLRASAAAETIAEELSVAQQALGEITGQRSSEDLLGEIFAGFCIGK